MHIRPFHPGDEPALFAVCYSAINQVASKNYTPEQIQAWAPKDLDQDLWTKHMQSIQPFVVESGGEIVAYADVQPSGYIDHFFVAGVHARRGIGSLLMNHLQSVAHTQAIAVLTADVSRTAQPFFARHGFVVVEQRLPVVRGVVIPNALMRKALAPNTNK